jgi:hypothetical protein
MENITKREYFAAMAMQGLLSNYKGYSNNDGDVKFVVRNSVIAADKLMEELALKQPFR